MNGKCSNLTGIHCLAAGQSNDPEIPGSELETPVYGFHRGQMSQKTLGIPVNDLLIGHTVDRPNQIHIKDVVSFCCTAFVFNLNSFVKGKVYPQKM